MKNNLDFQEKREPMVSAGFIAVILCLAFRIPLMNMIGAEGLAFFAPVNELFLLCVAFCNVGFAEGLSNMMKYRVKREQYRNAQRIFRAAYTLTGFFAIIVVVLIYIFNNFISEVLFNQNFSKMALFMIAPAIAIMAFTCLLRGYFQGMGSPYPGAHSMVVEQVFTIGMGLLLASYFLDYGEKVAAILRNDSFALSYGAMGAALGITVAAIISLLHLLIIFLMYRGTTKRQIYRDNSRQIETPGFIYQTLIVSAIPTGAFIVMYQVNHLIDQRIFYYYFNRLNENGDIIFNKAEVWGTYYGIFLVVIGILTALVSMIFMKTSRSVASAWISEEYRSGREQMMQAITQTIIVAFPLATLTAVLASPIASLFDKGDHETTVRVLQFGSVLIVLLAFSYFWLDLLKQFKRTVQMLVLIGGGLTVHILSLIFIMPMITKAEQLITGIVVTNILGAGFSFIVGFFLVSRMLKYHGEWTNRNFRTLVVTLICSLVIGLMGLLLSKALVNLVGPALTIIICLIISIVAYFVLMTLLRGLTVSDLDRLPGGQILIRLGRMIRYY